MNPDYFKGTVIESEAEKLKATPGYVIPSLSRDRVNPHR
jgi:hypothetical protein